MIIVDSKGPKSQVFQDGKFKGLPVSLVYDILKGKYTLTEVRQKGWIYSDSEHELIITMVEAAWGEHGGRKWGQKHERMKRALQAARGFEKFRKKTRNDRKATKQG